MAEEQRNSRTFVGKVVSSAMDKTVVVRVDRKKMHRRYKKYVTVAKKYMAHDAENVCNVGDKVEIVESRPLSARKRWVVTRQLTIHQD